MQSLKDEQRMKEAAEAAQKVKEDAQTAKKLEELNRISGHAPWLSDDDKDLMRRGAAYFGAAGVSAWIRHNVHQYGTSRAEGYERSVLGVLQNFKQFKKAPGPIKAASLIGIGTGMALGAGTEFMSKLKQRVFGQKKE